MTRAMVLLTALVAGCASAQPAPIVYGESGAERQAEPAPAGDPPSAPDWAAGEGTPLSAYALRPEEAHPFDPARAPRTHRVRENESLYDIADAYQIPLRALIDQNGLAPPYALAPGRDLQLPPPRIHEVGRGESFEDVARRYNVDLRSLALLNRMQPPYRVRAGDRVVLPAMARASDRATAAPPSESGNRSGSTVASPAGAPARLAWPLRGDIVARFGAQPGGGHLDGVEIAGLEGDRIVAAADGEVVYAGSDLPAYGTLVLVRHADDYVTAYGFTRRALVREGQRVRAGEPVAELGARQDGRARLLFQVRRGSEAVDPAPLLGLTAQ